MPVTPIDKVAAFRMLNRAEECVYTAYSLIDTAQLLYPEMDTKFHKAIREAAEYLSGRVCRLGATEAPPCR